MLEHSKPKMHLLIPKSKQLEFGLYSHRGNKQVMRIWTLMTLVNKLIRKNKLVLTQNLDLNDFGRLLNHHITPDI